MLLAHIIHVYQSLSFNLSWGSQG